jgi:ribosome-associated toxin RatA of RatAB toxin-antitoxin module
MWKIEDNQFDFSMTQIIEAPRHIVYQTLVNFEAYPEFINDVASVTRQGNDIIQAVVKVAILTITGRARVKETLDRELVFELIEGPVEVMQGTWQIADGEKTGQTLVTLNLRMVASEHSMWLLQMAGKFVQSKTEKLVEAFQKRVDAVSRGEVAAVPTDRSSIRFLTAIKRQWERITGKTTREASTVIAPQVFTNAHQIATLDSLAGTMIPPDDFDQGAQGMGFAEVAEVRARYETGRAEIYLTGIRVVDDIAKEMYGNDFTSLDLDQRTKLMTMVHDGKFNQKSWGSISSGDFFGALLEDILFLYCTHPDTWQRLGWPGPSFDKGGYVDFDQAQTFAGGK